MNTALLTFALAVIQMYAAAAAQGRLPNEEELADLERSDASIALKRGRWKSMLPKKDGE